MSDALPDRLWRSCSFHDEGKVEAEGAGRLDLWERFTISANGRTIDMIVTELRTPRWTWRAQDVDSFLRERAKDATP